MDSSSFRVLASLDAVQPFSVKPAILAYEANLESESSKTHLRKARLENWMTDDFVDLPFDDATILEDSQLYPLKCDHYVSFPYSEKFTCCKGSSRILVLYFRLGSRVDCIEHSALYSTFADKFRAYLACCRVESEVESDFYCPEDSCFTLMCPHIAQDLDFILDEKHFVSLLNTHLEYSRQAYGMVQKPVSWVDAILSEASSPDTHLWKWSLFQTASLLCNKNSYRLKFLAAYHMERYRRLTRNWVQVQGVLNFATFDNFSDLLGQFTSTLASAFSMAKEVSQRVALGVVAALRSIFEAVTDMATWSFKSAVDSFINSSLKSIASMIGARIDEFRSVIQSPIFHTLLKTILRMWIGFPTIFILVDIGLDIDFLGAAKDAMLALISSPPEDKDEGIRVEGAEDTLLTTIIATFIGGLVTGSSLLYGGIKPAFAADLLRNISMAARLDSQLKLKETVHAFLRYMNVSDAPSADFVRAQIKYPMSIELYEVFKLVADVGQPDPELRLRLRFYYGKYLDECKTFSSEDRVYMTTLLNPVLRHIQNEGLGAVGATRAQPDFYCAFGPAGLGKSTVLGQVRDIIAEKECQRLRKINPDIPITRNDVAWCHNSGDSYASGYKDQDIIFFDEFMLKVDTQAVPAPEIALLGAFGGTQPVSLNMAAVGDKGRSGRCNLMIGATNLGFSPNERNSTEVIRKFLQSVATPSSVRRRITKLVQPCIKAPYKFDADGNRILLNDEPLREHVDPCDLYNFLLFNTNDKAIKSPRGKTFWTFDELVLDMYTSYLRCQNYRPDNDLLARDVARLDAALAPPPDPELDFDQDCLELEPQGIWDIVSSLSSYANRVWDRAAFVCTCGEENSIPLDEASQPCVNEFMKYYDWDELFRFNSVSAFKCMWDAKHNFSLGVTHPVRITQHMSGLGVRPIRSGAWVWSREHRTKDSASGFAVRLVDPQEAEDIRDNEKIPVRSFADVRSALDSLLHCPNFGGHLIKIEKPEYSGTWLNLAGSVYYIRPLIRLDAVINHAPIYRTTGFQVAGFLVLFAIGVGIRIVARRQLLKAQSASQPPDLIVDGETYANCGDGMFVRAEARMSFKDDKGRQYVIIRRGAGSYKVYPEGCDPTNKYIDALEMRRFDTQVPIISNNIWAIVDVDDGVLCGNLLCLNETKALMPYHVARIMETRQVMFKRDSLIMYPTPPLPRVPSYQIDRIDEQDLCVVTFNNDRFRNLRFVDGRDLMKKFSAADGTINITGEAKFLHRDAKGVLSTSSGAFSPTGQNCRYAYPPGSEGESYILPAARARLVDVHSERGMCGGVYVQKGQSSSCILGIHVARDIGQKRAICMTIDPESLKTVRAVFGTAYPPECADASKGGDLSAAGFHATSNPVLPVRPAKGKTRVTKFRDLTNCGYAPSLMQPAIIPDVVVSGEGPVSSRIIMPAVNAARKLYEKSVAMPRQATGLLEAFEAQLRWCKPYFNEHPLQDFEQVITFESGLNSMDRHKSSGQPWSLFGSLKSFAFEDGEELILKPEFLDTMRWAELQLVPDDFDVRDENDFPTLQAICIAVMKDEARPIAKVLEGATRLVTVPPFHEILLERKYFRDLAVAFSEANLVFSSALGIDPDSYGHIHAHLTRFCANPKILAMDFKYMDGSFIARVMRLLAWYFISFYGNEGTRKRFVDPLLPPLNHDNFMRWRLIQRLAKFRLAYKHEIIVPGVSHPSGSFLTTLFNIACQQGLWVDAIAYSIMIAMPDSEKLSFDELEILRDKIIVECPMIFLGDDSLVAIPPEYGITGEDIVSRIFEQGFVMTDCSKDGDIFDYDCWDGQGVSAYTFLSRRFATTRSGDIVGVLDGERLFKMLHFCAAGKMHENFPMQVLSFVQEVERWSRCECANDVLNKARLILDDIYPNFLDFALLTLDRPEEIMRAVIETLVAKPSLCELTRLDSRTHLELLDSISVEPQGPGDKDESKGKEPVEDPASSNPIAKFVGNEACEEVVLDHAHNTLRSHNMDKEKNTGVHVLARPYRVAAGNIVAASVGVVSTVRVPGSFFDGNFKAQSEIANWAFLRCLFKCRFVFPPSPYSSALVYMYVRPRWIGAAATFVEASSHPGVLIDVASGKSGTLSVPTILPRGWSECELYQNGILQQGFDWAYIDVYLISGLRDITTNPINYSIFCWLEEVELHGPTVTLFTMSAQGPGEEIFRDKSAKGKAPSTSALLQKEGIAPTELGENAGTLAKVKNTISTIGGTLVEVAKVVIVGIELAALCGFSKPCDDEPSATYIVGLANATAPHFIGRCSSIKMATFQGQKIVTPNHAFGVGFDEMDVKKFCSRWGCIFRTTWTTASATGTTLFTLPNAPQLIDTTLVGYTGFTPLGFASLFFAYYRGGIKYRFVLSKTNFHTGILEVIFQAGTNRNVGVTETRAASLHRVIWDIQESHVLELHVPFISPTQWCSVVPVSVGFPVNDPSNATGCIYVRVVSPLADSSNMVTTTIDINLFMASDDMEFAVPSCRIDASVPAPMHPLEEFNEVECEGGPFQDDAPEEVSFDLATATPFGLQGNVCCIGERVPNLRLLSRRFDDVVEWPFDLVNQRWVWSFVDALANHLPMLAMSQAFSCVTGSFRVNLCFAEPPMSTTHSLRVFTQVGWDPAIPGPVVPWAGCCAVVPTTDTTSSVFDVPWYGTVPWYWVSTALTADTITGPPNRMQMYATGPPYILGSDPVIYSSFAFGDDFSFGWQKGIPAIHNTQLRGGRNVQIAG